MDESNQTVRERVLRLVEEQPGLTVREIAEQVGVSRDDVKPVLVDQLAQTGETRLPRARRSINRLAE